MFRLLRYFSITSAIVLITVTIVLVIFYRQTAIDEMVGMAERQNAVLARAFANAIWPRFWPILISFDAQNVDQFKANDEIQ